MTDAPLEPTPEQQARLATITDPQQREALLRAIARGEPIPDVAWTPVPEMTPEQRDALDEAIRPLAERLARMAIAGIDISPAFEPIEEDEERIDLASRPSTYWPDEDSLELRVSRIKGEQRRLRAEELLRQDRTDELEAEQLFGEDLDAIDREAWGSIHPMNMGGEYLPDDQEGEVEIARISLASVTGDVTSIRARRDGDAIAYRVVDEYGTTFEIEPARSLQPLTLGELIGLIDTAHNPDWDEYGDGLVFAVLADWQANGSDPDSLLTAVWASSGFYPQLAVHYRRAIAARVAEHPSADGGADV